MKHGDGNSQALMLDNAYQEREKVRQVDTSGEVDLFLLEESSDIGNQLCTPVS